MIFGDFALEIGEFCDIFGVFTYFDFDTFFHKSVKTSAGALFKIAQKGRFFGGEIENPSMFRLDVMDFFVTILSQYGRV